MEFLTNLVELAKTNSTTTVLALLFAWLWWREKQANSDLVEKLMQDQYNNIERIVSNFTDINDKNNSNFNEFKDDVVKAITESKMELLKELYSMNSDIGDKIINNKGDR